MSQTEYVSADAVAIEDGPKVAGKEEQFSGILDWAAFGCALAGIVFSILCVIPAVGCLATGGFVTALLYGSVAGIMVVVWKREPGKKKFALLIIILGLIAFLFGIIVASLAIANGIMEWTVSSIAFVDGMAIPILFVLYHLMKTGKIKQPNFAFMRPKPQVVVIQQEQQAPQYVYVAPDMAQSSQPQPQVVIEDESSTTAPAAIL